MSPRLFFEDSKESSVFFRGFKRVLRFFSRIQKIGGGEGSPPPPPRSLFQKVGGHNPIFTLNKTPTDTSTTKMTSVSIQELHLLRDQIIADTGKRSCRALRQVNRLLLDAKKDKERARLPIVTATRVQPTVDMGIDSQDMDEFPMTNEERAQLRRELNRVERNLAQPPVTPPGQIMERPTAPPPLLNNRLVQAALELDSSSSDDEALNWPFGLVRSRCVPPRHAVVDLTNE